jgi:hypothetical protein
MAQEKKMSKEKVSLKVDGVDVGEAMTDLSNLIPKELLIEPPPEITIRFESKQTIEGTLRMRPLSQERKNSLQEILGTVTDDKQAIIDAMNYMQRGSKEWDSLFSSIASLSAFNFAAMNLPPTVELLLLESIARDAKMAGVPGRFVDSSMLKMKKAIDSFRKALNELGCFGQTEQKGESDGGK